VVALVAMASAAVAYQVVSLNRGDPNTITFFLSGVSVPVLLCAAVGVIRGHLKNWLVYGVLTDLVLVGLSVLHLLSSVRGR
jgi:mannose/fructose/N-acetylgalactosamine-specific phosphotransferase system component IIC